MSASAYEPYVISVDATVVNARLAALPDVLLDEMVPAVVESQLLLEREIKERTPTSGAGTLRDSMGALPVMLTESAVRGEVGSALSYALPVELGSRPHRPPIEPLADWVRRKLGKPADEARGIAFGIAAKIAQHGTPAHHMASEGLKATQAQIQELLEAAASRAVSRVGQ